MLFAATLSALMLLGCVTTAPVAKGHPNLVEAQSMLDSAIAKIDAAQAANDFDMSGYAAKAKETIIQAKEQINLATQSANGKESGKVSAAVSETPEVNISSKRHPNLADAQKFVLMAYDKLSAAQKANDYDMEGHAQKAKDLLDKANILLKQAAEAANKNK
jgi:hypothetical protein